MFYVSLLLLINPNNKYVFIFLIGSTSSTRDGTQTPSIDRISAITKGFRRGELVVITGSNLLVFSNRLYLNIF